MIDMIEIDVYCTVDLNECERGEHKCDRNAICINLEGTFECQCAEGYQGDGHICRSNILVSVDIILPVIK